VFREGVTTLCSYVYGHNGPGQSRPTQPNRVRSPPQQSRRFRFPKSEGRHERSPTTTQRRDYSEPVLYSEPALTVSGQTPHGESVMHNHSSSLADLHRLLPGYRNAYWTDHFHERADLRGFSGKLLPEIWEMGNWTPANRDRWAIRHLRADGIWEVIVDFNIDPMRPWLISVAWEPVRFSA
jgi:hypothetical protein